MKRKDIAEKNKAKGNKKAAAMADEKTALANYDLLLRIPDEVWNEIFRTVTNRFEPYDSYLKYLDLEKELKNLSCVAKIWSPYVKEAIKFRFDGKGKKFSNWILLHFRDCESLDIAGVSDYCPNIVDSTILQLSNLKSLDLKFNTRITVACVEKLASSLTHLDLSYNRLIDDAALMKLTNLRSLVLVYNDLISDQGLACLTGLETLDVRDNSKITNASIGKLTNLASISLGGVECWFRIGHESISKLTNLTDLSVAEILSDADLPQGWFNMEPIDRSQRVDEKFRICNETVQQLINLRRLHLRCDTSKVTYSGFSNLSNLVALEFNLFYKKAPLVDEELKSLTNLTTLCMDSEKVGENGIRGLTNLTKLDIKGNSEISDDCITNFTRLRDLDLNSKITDKGLEKLSSLTRLELNYNTDISDECIMKLSQLTSLGRLTDYHSIEEWRKKCLSTRK